MLKLGKTVIIYESFAPGEEDADKTRGRGGYLTTREWLRIFNYLLREYRITFFRPRLFPKNEEIAKNIESILREVDTICFSVEKKGEL